MGVEVCSSPRISFSHNLCPSQSESVRVEHRPCPTHSSSFDFTFYDLHDHLLHVQQPCSSAEELFSDGKILPAAGIFPKTPPISPPPPDHHRPVLDAQKQKSFWGFKKSRSVNNSSSSGKYGLLRNFQIIPRSKSTGSTVKSHREKPPPPPLPLPPKKSGYGGSSSSGGIHLNTVLNVPIANLCGFASLCFTGKDSSSKKCQ